MNKQEDKCCIQSCNTTRQFVVEVIDNRQLAQSMTFCATHFAEFQNSQRLVNDRPPYPSDDYEFDVDQIVIDMSTSAGYVRLTSRNLRYSLAVTTGFCELTALYNIICQPDLERPLTFQCWLATIEALGATMKAAIIDDWSNGIFFAKLHVDVKGRSHMIDGRPSDAINLAMASGTPILIAATVLSKTYK